MSVSDCLGFMHKYEGVHYASVYPNDVLERVSDFAFRPDDIVIAGSVKSGGISISELTWLIMNDADFKQAGEHSLRGRVPIIELKPPGHPPVMDELAEEPSPRLMATFLYSHFYAENILKADCKVLLLLRNPKDVLVSFYHFYRMCTMCGSFSGTFTEFFEMVKDKCLNLGDWFELSSSWLKDHQGRNKFKVIHFEDFIKEPKTFVADVAAFCGKELSDDKIADIAEYVKFENMAKNPSANMRDIPVYKQDISPIFRKGIIGDWKAYFSPAQNEYVEKLYQEHIKSRGVELQFE